MTTSPESPEAPERAEKATGLLDTSVYIDLERIDEGRLPDALSLSTVTLAELASGIHAAKDPVMQARRQQDLNNAETQFHVFPFDVRAARAYGLVTGMVREAGRNPRRRFADQMIAAVAITHELTLYTRNAKDFAGLESVLRVVAV